MGPKWTKPEATASAALPQHRDKRARRTHGERMKFIVNNPKNDHEWYEAHSAIPWKTLGADGKPTGCTLIDWEEDAWECSADHIFKGWSGAGGVTLSGNGDFKVGDHIVTAWIQQNGKCYEGKILDIDYDAQVARLKMRDNNDSWIPFVWIHKLVRPTWEELGWVDPNAVVAASGNADGGGGNTSGGPLEKIFWILNNSAYPELRKLEGCETLTDLKATTTDCQDIMKMAKGFGVPDENIYRNEEPTFAEMKKTFMDIFKKSKALSAAKKPHIIMVYCGGHGAT